MNTEPNNTPLDIPATSATDALDLIWGCAAIGAAIGKTGKATYYMCASGELPAKLVGGRWVASRRKLREHFEGAGA